MSIEKGQRVCALQETIEATSFRFFVPLSSCFFRVIFLFPFSESFFLNLAKLC